MGEVYWERTIREFLEVDDCAHENMCTWEKAQENLWKGRDQETLRFFKEMFDKIKKECNHPLVTTNTTTQLQAFNAPMYEEKKSDIIAPVPKPKPSDVKNIPFNTQIDDAKCDFKQSHYQHCEVGNDEFHTNLDQLKKQCEVFKRLKKVLRAYNVGENTCDGYPNDNYGHQQLFNDFCHVKRKHIDAENNKIRDHEHHEGCGCKYVNIGKAIADDLCATDSCYEPERKNKDETKNNDFLCPAFRNRYRNRNDDETENKDPVFLQELAKLHTYFAHSPMRLGVKVDQSNVSMEKYYDDIYNSKCKDVKLSRIDNRDHFALATDQEELVLQQSASNDGTGNENKTENNAEKAKDIPLKKKTTYVGEREDDKWWGDVDINIDRDDKIYEKLVLNMGVFRWQNPHGFAPGKNREVAQYTPKYKNIKEEVLQKSENTNKKYAPLSIDNWNETLRKAKIFYTGWAGQKIRTQTDGSYVDQVTGQKETWKKGIRISMAGIVTLKLYTDFDKLQFELKKCFRFETVADILKENDKERYERTKKALQARLEHFYHWRGGLLIVLNKFGTKLRDKDNMELYHGVNCKMIIKPNRTYAFSGPLSTTSSYHVARTFATAKGMILKINSQFPRLGYCNAFDVSLMSDYPEEEEWLVGFMYVRILEVRTRKLMDDMSQFDCSTLTICKETGATVPISSWVRQEFFAIHLFSEQIFTMSEDLERILAQFLKVNRQECCVPNEKYSKQHDDNDDWKPGCCMIHYMCKLFHHGMSDEEIKQEKLKKIEEYRKNQQTTQQSNAENESTDVEEKVEVTKQKLEDMEKKTKIFPVLWEKFNQFRKEPNIRQCVKFDKISNYLKRFFMEESDEKAIESGNSKWIPSFDEIVQVYPNIKEIHFINEYKLTKELLNKLKEHIKPQEEKAKKEEEKKEETTDEEITQKKSKDSPIEKIVFLYYNYKEGDDNNKPLNHSTFKDPDDEDIKNNIPNGWVLKHGKNGQIGYKIRLYKH